MESQTAWWLSKSGPPTVDVRCISNILCNSTNGNLWIAVYASNRVMQFNPSGKHLTDVVLPAYGVACTTWGGPDFDTLFIATGKDRSEHPRENDKGGHIYAFKPPGVKGYPKYEFGG